MKILFTIGMAIIYTIMGHLIHMIKDVETIRFHGAYILSICMYVALWIVGVILFYMVFSDKYNGKG
jgi:hypothetical protein